MAYVKIETDHRNLWKHYVTVFKNGNKYEFTDLQSEFLKGFMHSFVLEADIIDWQNVVESIHTNPSFAAFAFLCKHPPYISPEARLVKQASASMVSIGIPFNTLLKAAKDGFANGDPEWMVFADLCNLIAEKKASEM